MRILAVTNMYPTSQAPALGTFVEQQVSGLRQVGLDVDVMVVDRTQRGIGAYMRLGQQVRSRVVDIQPDLVHVMYGGVMANKVTHAVTERPTVVSFCGSDLLGETWPGYLKNLMTSYGVSASRRAASRASGIVVKSKNLQDALPHAVDRAKVRIIPNGIDFERFKPLDRAACRNQLGWREDRLHILFPTNSGTPRKRPGLARAAVEAVNSLGISAEMHQLQRVAHDQVSVWLSASDLLLVTSLHEGSPNIVKEALACDVPIVSVDVGDVRERIQGIDGCYLALPDPNDLADKLRLVHAGPRRVQGRARMEMQELGLERVALRLKGFYEEVLASYTCA
jgi:glycosyltransferase involved in cell wall biosynthesis